MTGLILGGRIASLIIPAAVDQNVFSRLIHPINDRVYAAKVHSVADRMRTVLAPLRKDIDFDHEARAYRRMRSEQYWCHWRARSGKNQQLRTTVTGFENLQSALDSGRGVILWGMEFCGTLVPKIALHRREVKISQLSIQDHGVPPPATAYGKRFLGPHICAIEECYMEQRIYIPNNGTKRYLRTLKDKLVSGGCVWIAGERPARLKNIPVPFLGRRKAFATGAPSLAWSTGASLLPVYTIRKGTFDYETVVGLPIAPRTEASLKAVYVKAAVTEFAAILEQKILAYPANWTWTAYSVYQLLARKHSR